MLTTGMTCYSVILYHLYRAHQYTAEKSARCILYRYASRRLSYKKTTAKYLPDMESAHYNYKDEA